MKDVKTFIEEYCYGLTLNMNDTFGYATAWGIDVEPSDIPKLLEIEEKYQGHGVNAFAGIIQEVDDLILPPLNSEQYKAALEALKGYTFLSKSNCYKEYHYILCDCKAEREILGAPVQYRYEGDKSKEGYSIVTAFTSNGKSHKDTNMNNARKGLLEKYKNG